ncbi:MAG TPA: heme-binding protein [Blastocatellia bacterium]
MFKRHTSLKLQSLLFAAVLIGLTGQTLASLTQSAQSPTINVQACAFDAGQGRLTIKGANFQKGATVSLRSAAGQPVSYGSVKVKSAAKIFVNGVAESDLAGGLNVTVTNPDGSSVSAHLEVMASDDGQLTDTDVKQIIAQAAAQADASALKATIAVVDKEGNVLGVFTMNGANANTTVTLPNRGPRGGLEGVTVPACAAAISKAVTGSFLSSQGHAFSTRTASFIVQEHFPPGVNFQAGGPLFGVQFSQLLCSDVNARSPLGLSADPGGLPLYKNGVKVGGVGIEGDGHYTLDPDPADKDVPAEEVIAVAATRNFEAPDAITGDKIIVNGIRFTYVNAAMPPATSVPAFAQLNGSLNTCLGLAPAAVRGSQASKFHVITLDASIPAGRVDDRFFPFKSGSALTASEVKTLIAQAAAQAFKTRAAIRQPENSPAEVNITVCDTDGTILGIFSTIDAPIFGFDVSAQKARTAAFFSSANAATRLRQAGFGNYVDAAAKDGLKLDGSVAFSDRAGGFLSRPFFPDGIDGTPNGPFSKPIDEWSPFNDGLQLDLVLDEYFGNLLRGIGGNAAALTNALTPPCPSLPAIANGIQIFPGSVPVYKGGKLVGGLGISGDGVDQDDIIATMGSAGFESPAEIRSDRVFVRGVRLPFVKFPRHPDR